MDKNTSDKLTLILVIGLLIFNVFLVIHMNNISDLMSDLASRMYDIAYTAGVHTEKIGTLEELVPLQPVRNVRGE